MSFVRMNPQMTTLPAGTFFTEGVRILPGPPMVPHPQYKADVQKFVPGTSATTYLPTSTPLVYKTTPQIAPQITPTSQITSAPQIKKEIPALVNNPPQVKQQSPPQPQPPQNKPTVTTRSKAASPPPICTLTPQLPEYKFEVPELPECPVFRPSEEEFTDPMKYLSSIKEIGQKYGICKVIPPSDKWLQGKPFFNNVDPENFLFPTKIQTIHQLQNRNGPYQRFIDDLEKFLEKKKMAFKSIPVIDGHEVDLLKFYKSVITRGGVHNVSSKKLWKEVAVELRIDPENPSLAFVLKQHYIRYLLPYEDYQRSKGHLLDFDQDPNFTASPTKESKSNKKQKKEAKKEEEDEEDDFGYYDGKMFSLNSYKKMADNYKKRWFPNEKDATPREIEKLYWNLVESADECVRVHYGSDVEVSVYGSGFVNTPEELSKASGWNLNKFSTMPGSLLAYLNEQISGVTSPMMYIGMLFSTFCWHTEDNYLYSINYLHHGAPKTWYGIPDSAAEEFEKLMRNTVPDLFSVQPNLLFLLVTMISTRILAANKIPVYTTIQQPGEFMITFPKGYHAGFSHGFNCAESSNFALEDWIPFGKECVERYRHYGRSSVLSIEKLLCEAAKAIDGPSLIPYLREELMTMRSRELYLREKVLQREGTWKCLSFDKYSNTELIECSLCKYDCYLSAIVCPCSPNTVVCLRHSEKTCDCDASRKYFLFRYKTSELNNLLINAGCNIDTIENDKKDNKKSTKLNLLAKGNTRKGPSKLVRGFSKLMGVTKPAIRHLSRRAGIKKVNGISYEDQQNNKEQMVILESVLSQRSVNGRTEYLLKWEGYNNKECTWERSSEMCCPVLIDMFKNKGKEHLVKKWVSPRTSTKSRRMGSVKM